MSKFMIRDNIKKSFDNVRLKGREETLKAVYENMGEACGDKVNGRDIRRYDILKPVLCALTMIMIAFTALMVSKNFSKVRCAEIVNAPLALSVYMYDASENGEAAYAEMTLGNSIKIDNKYNPVDSSASGIGIHFELIYDGGLISMETDSGIFRTWDIEKGEGVVDDAGNYYEIKDRGHLFFSPKNQEDSIIKVIIYKENNIVGLAKIKVRDDGEGSFFASLEKTAGIPMVDGKYQTVNENYVKDFFEE